MKYHKGFTLIELMTVISIVAVLAAVAIPSYKSYLYRAHAAEVVSMHDAMRTKALSTVSADGSSLCNWISSQNNLGIDESFDQIETIVRQSLGTLNKNKWTVDSSTSNNSSASMTNTTLVVEYIGVGKQGADQIKALARVFEKNGLFYKWKQQSNLLSSFTAFLDHCDSVNQTVVTGVGITGATGIASEIESSVSEPELQPLSAKKRRQQCRANCRIIFSDIRIRHSNNWKAVKGKARKDLKQCNKECNVIR